MVFFDKLTLVMIMIKLKTHGYNVSIDRLKCLTFSQNVLDRNYCSTHSEYFSNKTARLALRRPAVTSIHSLIFLKF